MTILRHANNFSTTLNGAINNSVTTITVTDATGFPAVDSTSGIFDSGDLSGITLSSNDTVATKASGTKAGVGGTSTINKTTGAWYFEFIVGTLTGSWMFLGISPKAADRTIDLGQSANTYAYGNTGDRYFDTSFSNDVYSTFVSTDIIGVAYDIDNDTIEFFKNGVSQGVESVTFDSGTGYAPAISMDANSDSVTIIINPNDFTYTPPTGFSPLIDDISAYITVETTDAATNEIMLATAISGNDITVVRGQQGTSASAFGDLDIVEIRPTKDSFDRKADGAISSDDGNIVLFDGATGKVLKDSGTTIQNLENTVDSVNGLTGTVVLDPDDLDDTGTTNKFTTSAEISKLAGIETSADVTDEANVKAALDGMVTTQVTPVSGDKILLLDASDSDNLKHALFSAFGGGGGKILQVQTTSKTDTFSTTSSTFTDITGLSVSITPSATTSTILVIAAIGVANNTNDASVFVRAMRGSTPILVGATAGSRTSCTGHMRLSLSSNHDKMVYFMSFAGVDSPSTTSATTYKLQMQVDNTTTGYVNRTSDDADSAGRPRTSSSITVLEIGV